MRSTEFLPEALSSFLAAHPNVSVDLEERLSDEIVGLIAEGVGDIGIVAGTVDAGRLTTYPFRSDRFVLVVARDHPLARRSKIGFAEVLDHDFVGLDRASALAALPRRQGEQHRAAAAAARAAAQLRRGLPAGRVQCRASASCRPPPRGGRPRRMAIKAVDLTDPWALRDLTICVRDLEALPPYARQLVEHMRAGAN